MIQLRPMPFETDENSEARKLGTWGRTRGLDFGELHRMIAASGDGSGREEGGRSDGEDGLRGTNFLA